MIIYTARIIFQNFLLGIFFESWGPKCRLTFKIDDIPAHLIKQTARFAVGWYVGERKPHKGTCADWGFSNPEPPDEGGGALIVCYTQLKLPHLLFGFIFFFLYILIIIFFLFLTGHYCIGIYTPIH